MSSTEASSEVERLRRQLWEAEEILRAIREGEVDAFVMQSAGEYRVESLAGADTPYRLLVESIRDGALTVSSQGAVLFCNRAFADRVGVAVAEVIHTPVARWLSVSPALEPLFEQALRREAQAEGALRTARGLVPVAATACALANEAGAPVYCLVLTDLSDRVTAERLRAEQVSLERQRAELDAICLRLPFGVLLAEEPDLYRYSNPAAKSLLAAHPELRSCAERAAGRALEGRTDEHEDVTLGAEGMFRLRATPLMLPGSTPRALVVIQDRTAERQAQLVRERQEQLRETFVGILGHDLRTPLMAITHAAYLLQNDDGKEQVARARARIEAAAARMKRLIDDMLDMTLSRIGGGIPVFPERVDLNAIVQAALEDLQGASESRMALHTRGDTYGEWDPARLGQVLSNLLSNALKHGAPAGPIDIQLDGSDPERVSFAVLNQGAPIAPEVLSSIFDPFRRGAGSGSRGTGVGLGLYIAERIVAAHGGSIRVTSTEAQGTRFTAVLPRSARAGG